MPARHPGAGPCHERRPRPWLRIAQGLDAARSTLLVRRAAGSIVWADLAFVHEPGIRPTLDQPRFAWAILMPGTAIRGRPMDEVDGEAGPHGGSRTVHPAAGHGLDSSCLGRAATAAGRRGHAPAVTSTAFSSDGTRARTADWLVVEAMTQTWRGSR